MRLRGNKIAVVQGTRPEIIKNYSIVKALRLSDTPHIVLHTNQHSDGAMAGGIYAAMGYRPNDAMAERYRLGTAINWLQDRYRQHGVTRVLVNGDTAASLAGAVAALYSDLEIVHVEAGLRSADSVMLEERNRIMVDAIAHHLFAYTELERTLLSDNPEIRGRVYLEGNTTVDVLHDFAAQINAPDIREPFLFGTMHRKEFTDSPERMRTVLKALDEISQRQIRVVLPLHPRTENVANQHRIALRDYRNIQFVPPMPVFDCLSHQKHARAVITDSGCVQEESYLLGVPCITVRDNTERHLTVAHGANRLTGFSSAAIKAAVDAALSSPTGDWPDIYGTPGAGARIVQRITAHG